MIMDQYYLYQTVRRKVVSHWNEGNYTAASEILRTAISAARNEKDWFNWVDLVGLLKMTYLEAGQTENAKSLLMDSISVYPACFSLYERLADIWWISEKRPDEALRIIQDFLATHGQAISLEYQIQTYNYLARLHVANRQFDQAVGCIVWVVGHLPRFSPAKGYLFDVTTIMEAYQAGVRHPILLEYMNRIEDPHWLADNLTKSEFDQLKAKIQLTQQ